ncbi:DUF5687 family protein [Ascidiimonas sp. W6]|uniref:DUF5687 family protein n=1 Tax=Ascidiimonas meishanensis TaxID=3128903 RepID=UPI0030EBD24C
MFKHFISLQWKSFFRSASVGKSIGLKILMGFLALYFAFIFLGLGFGLFPILKKTLPDADPLQVVNSFVILWLAAEVFLRFFMQTLPVMDIKPLMTIPVKKGSVVHYVLLRAFASFFNLMPLLTIIPFGIICIVKGGYGAANMVGWIFAMFCLVMVANYANFLIKKKFAENIKGFLPFVLVGLVFAALEYVEVFKISEFTGRLMDVLVVNPVFALIPFVLMIGLYFWNYNFLRTNFYLDGSLKAKTAEASTTDLTWTKRFGGVGTFLQQDLKLIWRNKRPRTTVYLAFILLAYGLIFYPQEIYHTQMPAMFVFVGIFVTGIFMINFGQFIPSWDSSYFSMMMSQNIPLRKYLDSKIFLMTFSVVILYILSTPYVYFGWHILWLNTACAIYNIGVNIPVLMYAGSFNRKRIDLEKSPFMNYQGTGAAQWLVSIPLMVLPLLIWYAVYKFTSPNIASGVLFALGIVGILAKDLMMNQVIKSYRKNKYAMINGFKQTGD